MSFILDALKKSEADRQQKSSPGISDVPTALNPSGTPRGLWVLIGLLSLAVVVLLVVLLNPTAGPAPPPMATEPVHAEPSGAEMPIVPESVPASAENPPTRVEAPLATVEPERAQPAPPSPDRFGEPTSAAPAVAAAPAEADATETYLTFNDLRATGSLNLPDLHIDLHVYSANPAERFVFINMNQYRENATLSEGPRLSRITTEGVVLEFLGTTFLLPRE